MKKEKEYEYHKWQEGDFNISHLICFLFGIFITLFFIGLYYNVWFTVISFIVIALMIIISALPKRRIKRDDK